MINIGDSPPPVNVFKEIDADKDLMLSREEVRCSKLQKNLPVDTDNFYHYVQNSGVSFVNKGITYNPWCKWPGVSVL